MSETSSAEANGHVHSVSYASLPTLERGIWALKWSLIGLLLTTLLQDIIAYYSGSVALLADTVHNADASTAIPLWIAFRVSTWKPSAVHLRLRAD